MGYRDDQSRKGDVRKIADSKLSQLRVQTTRYAHDGAVD